VALVRREVAEARPRWGRLADTLLAHVEAEASRLDQPASLRVEAWATAVAAWDVIDRPYYAAYARSRLAEARLANGESRASVGEPLQAAASVARRLGAVPLLARIERLARMARVDLEASGPERAPTREAADPLETLGLTPREREILRFVAAGWSNAHIADALGITVSTASVHVSNILAKLDVENRVEAAALAHRLGVVGGEPAVAAPA
jgi:DNA-binding CsgD family transcriptional regulator